MIRSLLVRGARRGYNHIRNVMLPAVGHEIMRHRSPEQLLTQWPEGEIPLGPKVCVFVHWDGAGEVRPHVLHYVRSLASAGLSVVFVTNSGKLQDTAVKALTPLCAGIMVRRNIGYDFGAWREALLRLNLPRQDTELVAIANDSVYGPIRPLTELLATIDFKKADVWGCTDSWQYRFHLQSYLMVFSPKVVASEAWLRFWTAVRPTWSKTWLVRHYEIGLTQALLKAGFSMRAVWPYKTLVNNLDLALLEERGEEAPNLTDPMIQARRIQVMRLRGSVTGRIPLNPTSDLWRQLLQAGYPFIKRELLRDNPTQVSDLVEWQSVAAEWSQISLRPIERDLERTLKNKAP